MPMALRLSGILMGENFGAISISRRIFFGDRFLCAWLGCVSRWCGDRVREEGEVSLWLVASCLPR